MAQNGPFDPSDNIIDLAKFRARWQQNPGLGNFLGGNFFKKILLPLLAVIIGLKLFIFLCFVYVRPNEYGIKVVRVPVFGSRGVHKDVYEAGFHFVLKPFDCEGMYLFPKGIQVLDLTGAREEAAREATISKPAHIQTSDGFFVDVDASIIYKIVDPYLVFTRLGAGRAFETSGLMPKAEPVLKQTLGELTTEEFYNSPLRSAKAAMAKSFLNQELANYAIQVQPVPVRYFRYTEEIQKNIEEKKLKDQLV